MVQFYAAFARAPQPASQDQHREECPKGFDELLQLLNAQRVGGLRR